MSTLNQNTTNLQTVLDTTNSIRSDIATSLTNKGVTVPDDTKLDGMAALIDGIESGGSVETCTVAYSFKTYYTDTTLYYTDGNCTVHADTGVSSDGVVTCCKNTLFAVYVPYSHPESSCSSSDITLLQNKYYAGTALLVFSVGGNGSVRIYDGYASND